MILWKLSHPYSGGGEGRREERGGRRVERRWDRKRGGEGGRRGDRRSGFGGFERERGAFKLHYTIREYTNLFFCFVTLLEIYHNKNDIVLV